MFERELLHFQDDIVFETFHHKNGQTYSCIFTNGCRFYLDNYQNAVSANHFSLFVLYQRNVRLLFLFLVYKEVQGKKKVKHLSVGSLVEIFFAFLFTRCFSFPLPSYLPAVLDSCCFSFSLLIFRWNVILSLSFSFIQCAFLFSLLCFV